MAYNEKDMFVYKTYIAKMQAIASFPHDGKSFDSMLYARFAIPRIVLASPICLGVFGHLYQSIRRGHIFEAVSALYFINFAVMYYTANVILLARGNELLKFLKKISDMRKEHLKNYERTVLYVEILTKIVYYSVIFTIVAIMLESYMQDSFCNNGELVNEPHYICGAMLPLWFPLDKKYPTLKMICTFYILGYVLVQIPAMASSASFYLGSVEFIGLKMEKLIILIRKIDFEKENQEEAGKNLKFCIEYYTEICSISRGYVNGVPYIFTYDTRVQIKISGKSIGVVKLLFIMEGLLLHPRIFSKSLSLLMMISINILVNQMNNTIGYIFAPTHNAYNNLMMGILGYLSIKLGSLPNAFQLVIWLGVQWLSCYSGQRLENASTELREEVFKLSWYHIDPSLRSSFRIFHAHVSLPFHMKIQPIMRMNMENFASILRGAYTFLMYLLKM